MKALHKKRLLKLAKHLRSRKLGRKKFDFNVVNGDRDGRQLETNGCGYCGCAIGELPFVFPKQWSFVDGWPRLGGSKDIGSGGLDGAADFFGNADLAHHLFLPGCQKPHLYGGKILFGNATAKQVAANIEAFVKRKEKEGK